MQLGLITLAAFARCQAQDPAKARHWPLAYFGFCRTLRTDSLPTIRYEVHNSIPSQLVLFRSPVVQRQPLLSSVLPLFVPIPYSATAALHSVVPF